MDYPLWSRVYVAADANFNQQQSFFQYLAGQAGPGITIASDLDTNMPSNGQLPASHEMLIYSIQIIPDEVISQDVTVGKTTFNPGTLLPEQDVADAFSKWRSYFENLLFRFRIEQSKTYVEGRLDHFPQGGGLHIEHDAAVDESAEDAAAYVATYLITNGLQSWEAARRLATPIYIAPLETFRGILERPRGVPATGSGSTAPIPWQYTGGFTARLTGPRKRPAL